MDKGIHFFLVFWLDVFISIEIFDVTGDLHTETAGIEQIRIDASNPATACFDIVPSLF